MLPQKRNALAPCLVLAMGALHAGCGSYGGATSAPPPSGQSGPFTGGYVDSAGVGGVVTFTVEGGAGLSGVTDMLVAAAGDVTGSVQTAQGGSEALSGTYTAPGLELRDAGFNYQFMGTLQGDGRFEGISITPGGNGAWSAHPGDAASVQVLCGSYSRCSDPPGCTLYGYLGSLSLIVSGTSASAAVNSPDGPVVVPVTVSTAGGQVSVSLDFGQIHADGDLTGSSVSGTWSDSGGSGDTGTWSASSAECPITGP